MGLTTTQKMSALKRCGGKDYSSGWTNVWVADVDGTMMLSESHVMVPAENFRDLFDKFNLLDDNGYVAAGAYSVNGSVQRQDRDVPNPPR